MHLPLEVQDHLEGVIDVIHEEAVDEHDGAHVHVPVPEERRDEVDHDHELLVEAVVEHDDELLEHYLDGQLPSDDELEGQLATDIAAGEIVPVLCGSALEVIGVEPLLQFLVDEGPPPRRHDAVPEGTTAAFVAKTFSDPYVGRINVLRVLAGELNADDELVVLRTGARERAHQIFRLRGREQEPVEGVSTGDLVAVNKLGDVATGDVLTSDGSTVDMALPAAPDGFHRVVFESTSAADDAKLSTALARLADEDPAIRVTVDSTTGTRVVHLLGPVHTDVTVARLSRRHGVDVDVHPAPIDYRETIQKPATAEGRHVKQSGGHGQYGVVTIEIRPRPRGEGFAFSDKTVGGSVPRQFVSSVEKGVLDAMETGPLGGFPVVDVEVRLLDGKHHSVDSSDAAFQMAGILAFRDAVAQAQPVLLEPVMEVDIAVPDDLTGAVMSDLSGRRGRIMGTDAAGRGNTMIHAQVPEAELTTFAAEFRALTSGHGTVAMRYDHHEEVPDAIASRLIARDGDGD